MEGQGAIYSQALILYINGLGMSCPTPAVNPKLRGPEISSLISNGRAFGGNSLNCYILEAAESFSASLPLGRDEIPFGLRILGCEPSRPTQKRRSSGFNLLSWRIRALFQLMIIYFAIKVHSWVQKVRYWRNLKEMSKSLLTQYFFFGEKITTYYFCMSSYRNI